MNINKVILIGYMGFIGELKQSKSGINYINFSIATKSKEVTLWHNCTSFSKTAEFIEKNVSKGEKVYVEGSIDYSEYEKDGVKNKKTSIIVNQFLKLAWSDDNKTEEKQTNQNKKSSTFFDDIPF